MSKIREIICDDLNTDMLDGLHYPLVRVFNGNLYPAEIDGVPVDITDEDISALTIRGIKIRDVVRY